ncbi:MAG: hypothetical protein VKJ46_14070 [Leptolyngbyaceae bacterium]|nr:hypothetical protein [Leptolyngbyaceae bacterium]
MKPSKNQVRIHQTYGKILENQIFLAASLFGSILMTATAGIASTPATGVSATAAEAQVAKEMFRPKAALNGAIIASTPQISEGGMVLEPWVTAEGAKPAQQSSVQVAQATESDEQLRQKLRVEPVPGETSAAGRTYPPSSSSGIPSAFGANWGDAFIGASASGADRIRPEVDGGISMGFGVGNSLELVGLEATYNITSIRRFAENGTFDLKLHRYLYADKRTQVAAALGWTNFANYGKAAGATDSGVYGVVTGAYLLQPDNEINNMPLTISLGLGGGPFRENNASVGVFAGAGLQVAPQLSLNTAWSGVGLNVGASYVPIPTVPLTLGVDYADVTNSSAAGSKFILSVGYGFNFTPQF